VNWREVSAQIIADLRNGQRREAYTIFSVGLVLTLLGLFGVASQSVLLSGILIAATFLVFQTAIQLDSAAGTLELVLKNRDALGAFNAIIPDGGELWVYGPTAVNVLVNAPDIKAKVLSKGGRVRIVVQDPSSDAVRHTKNQLDDTLDFDHTLASSIATLRKMRAWGDCDYRLLACNPGFSLVVINPNRPDGFLILEMHGFSDDTITGRMHIRISRTDSLHWFDYWASRFNNLWQQGKNDNISTNLRRPGQRG
jgi:hypothetical protein